MTHRAEPSRRTLPQHATATRHDSHTPRPRSRSSAGSEHARIAYDVLAVHYDTFTAHHDYEQWTATLEGLANAHGLRGQRMLDVACGTGKSFLPFLDRGYEVTACDISGAMIAVAAGKAAGRARLEVCDMRRLPVLGAFDLVCCLDDAVNYLLGERQLEATFAGLARNLAPDGVVLFDANTVWAYQRFFGSMSVVTEPDRVLIWNGHAPADFAAGAQARATLEILVRADAERWRRQRTVHRQRHHSRAIVQRALRAAGLRPVAVYGMRLDGSVREGCRETRDSKAVYIARAVRA